MLLVNKMKWTIFILVIIAAFIEVKGQVKNVQVLDTKSSFRQLNNFKPFTGLRKNTFSSNSKELNDGKYHPEFHYGGEYLHDDSGKYIHDGTGNYNGDRGPQYQHLEPQSSIYQNSGNNNYQDDSNNSKYSADNNFNNQNQYHDNQDFGSSSSTSNSEFRSRSGFSSDGGSRFGSSSDSTSRFGSSSDSTSRFGSSSDSASRFGSSSDSASRFGSFSLTGSGFNNQGIDNSGFNPDNHDFENQNTKNPFGLANGFNTGFAKSTGNKDGQFASNGIKSGQFGNSVIKSTSPSKNSFGLNSKGSGNELDIGGTGSATVLSGQRASFISPARGSSGKYEGGSRIIKQEGDGDYDGYHYLYETENGINAEEKGKVANKGSDKEAMRAKGFYTYTGPDNVVYTIEYISDENGFQPVGAHIPTPPPTPEAILKALELQKQLGVL